MEDIFARLSVLSKVQCFTLPLLGDEFLWSRCCGCISCLIEAELQTLMVCEDTLHVQPRFFTSTGFGIKDFFLSFSG